MGHPKKQRKKYSKPKEPFDKDRIEKEKKIINEYGLKRKHEIQRTEALLRNFRRRARDLQAYHDEKRKAELFDKLVKMGLVDKGAKLEDVLGIRLESILARRLQSMVYKKGLANTPKHARQLIVHGHILVGKKRVVYPGYLVPSRLENTIELKGVTVGKIAENKTEKTAEVGGNQ